MIPRGALVDRCDACGTLLAPMMPGQHGDVEALYRDMAEQIDYPPGSGEMWTPFQWHQIMVGGYAEDKGWNPKFVPSPNGSGAMICVLRTQQSRLTKKQGAELVHYANAYAAERGVRRTMSKRQVRELAEQGGIPA